MSIIITSISFTSINLLYRCLMKVVISGLPIRKCAICLMLAPTLQESRPFVPKLIILIVSSPLPLWLSTIGIHVKSVPATNHRSLRVPATLSFRLIKRAGHIRKDKYFILLHGSCSGRTLLACNRRPGEIVPMRTVGTASICPGRDDRSLFAHDQTAADPENRPWFSIHHCRGRNALIL